MQTRTAVTIAEGVVAALIGHLAITVALIIGDVFGGHGALYTPTLLARVLLEGPPSDCAARGAGVLLLAYSSIHMVVLSLFGLLGSLLIGGSERRPILWFGGLLLFVMVVWHMTAAVLVAFGPARECVSLWWVVGASFIGAVAMGWYLWRAHPGLRSRLGTDQYA